MYLREDVPIVGPGGRGGTEALMPYVYIFIWHIDRNASK